MEQYIPKDTLIAEIERRRDAALMRQHNLEAIGQETCYNKMIANELNKIISLINTLKVKEVNLEKEIERVRKTHFINSDFEKATLEGRQITNIAKHFFELGLKAQE